MKRYCARGVLCCLACMGLILLMFCPGYGQNTADSGETEATDTARPSAISTTPTGTPIVDGPVKVWIHPERRMSIEEIKKLDAHGLMQEDLRPTPTLAPTPIPPDPHTVFVGVVGNRRLTKAELDHRVKHLVALLPVKPGTPEYDDAVLEQEGLVLKEWAENVVLAQEAHRQGFRLSDSEFEAQYKKLLSTAGSGIKLEDGLKKLGLTEGHLRAELRDSLLGGKLVEKEAANYNTEDHLKQAYQKAPHAFYRPAQIHVLHYSQTLEGNENRSELRHLMDKMEGIRRRIQKGEDPVEIARKEGGILMGALGSDLGWVAAGIRSLPLEVHKELASMKKGQTSSVILSKDDRGLPQAFHIIKVLDQRPETGHTYESAKPMLREHLHETIRHWLAPQLLSSGRYRVILNTSGIKPEILEKSPASSGTWTPTPAPPSRNDR